MRRYAERFFKDCPPGGVGRKRNLLDVARFLTYAVEECGAPMRFLPPSKSKVNELIGSPQTSTTEKLTPPIKPEDLAALLDQLAADGEHELRLAVGLVGLYGLRPAELAVLEVREGGKAYVGQVKRNSTSMGAKAKSARRVQPIDVAGREGEGERLLQLYASGLLKLPKSLRNQIAMVEEKGRFKMSAPTSPRSWSAMRRGGRWWPAALGSPPTHCGTAMRGGPTAAAPMPCTPALQQP